MSPWSFRVHAHIFSVFHMLHIFTVSFLFVSHAVPAERRLVADKRTAGGLNLANNFEDQNIFVQEYSCFGSLANNCEDQNMFVQEYSCITL